MSKYTNFSNFLSQLPDFVFDYIELAYNGERLILR